MNIVISTGNSKLGKIPNFSLSPIKSCGDNAKYCIQKQIGLKCYALKSYILFPTAKAAWDNNIEIVTNDITRFEVDMITYLSQYKGEFFRIHVSGDFINQRYLDSWISIVKLFPRIRFLAFTKRDDLQFKNIPSNLEIKYSIMPNQPETVPEGIKSKVWINKNNNEHRAFKCRGSCTTCKTCWNKGNVYMEIH